MHNEIRLQDEAEVGSKSLKFKIAVLKAPEIIPAESGYLFKKEYL